MTRTTSHPLKGAIVSIVSKEVAEMTDTAQLMKAYLGKWPRLIVVGEPVSPEQAMEILIRTDRLDFTSNDRGFSSKCASYFYGRQINSIYSFGDQFKGEDGKVDFSKYWGFKDKVKKEVGQIELEYLHNSRIMSCFIGGPHGWCDWSGYLGCSNYNIGKWPEVEELYQEWQAIATAFPYLELKSQLTGEDGEGDIVIEFEVKDGTVTVKKPGPLLQPVTDYDISQLGRSCTFDQFKQALDYTRNKVLPTL